MKYLLTDARMAPLLPGREGTKGGRSQDNRRFVEAVLWLLRNGSGLAGRVGQLAHDVHALPALDRLRGVGRVLAAVHTLLVDSTTVRAHQQASGARKKTDRRPWATAATA